MIIRNRTLGRSIDPVSAESIVTPSQISEEKIIDLQPKLDERMKKEEAVAKQRLANLEKARAARKAQLDANKEE